MTATITCERKTGQGTAEWGPLGRRERMRDGSECCETLLVSVCTVPPARRGRAYREEEPVEGHIVEDLEGHISLRGGRG
eukprot:scaffold182615_cov17-Tisochrysis_lutea.AAC.1